MLQSVDRFSRPIGLTLNGQARYKTSCGGCLTILAIILVIGYIALLYTNPLEFKFEVERIINNTVITQEESTAFEERFTKRIETKVNTIYQDFMQENLPIHNLTSHGFAIATKDFHAKELGFNSSFLEHNIQIGTPLEDGSLDWEHNEPIHCSPEIFPIDSWLEAVQHGIHLALCPSLSEFQLWGSEKGPDYKIVSFDLRKCEENNCETNETLIHEYMFEYGREAFALNSHYDFSNPENPVKQSIDKILSNPSNLAIQTIDEIAVRENEIVYLNGTTQTFYDAVPFDDYVYYNYHNEAQELSEIIVFMSQEKRIYEQYEVYIPILNNTRMLETSSQESTAKFKVESVQYLLYICSLLGGFCYFLKMVLGFILNIFIDTSLAADIINEVKFTRGQTKVEAEKKDKERLLKNKDKHQNNEDIESTSFQKLEEEKGGLQRIKTKSFNKSKSVIKDSKDMPKFYGFLDILSKTFSCKNKKNNVRDKPLKHGIEDFSVTKLGHDQSKLYKEMDIVRLLNEFKDFKTKLNSAIKSSKKNKEVIDEIMLSIKEDDNDFIQPTTLEGNDSTVFSKKEPKREIINKIETIKSHKSKAISSINSIINKELEQIHEVKETNKAQNFESGWYWKKGNNFEKSMSKDYEWNSDKQL